MLKNIVLLCLTALSASGRRYDDDRSWDGSWFPHVPNEQDSNPTVPVVEHDITDPKHGMKMGIKDSECDDGKTNLTIDWPMNPDNYTCLEKKELYHPSSYIHPIHSMEHIPAFYSAPHKCMNETIVYNHVIPTFGTHRPLWPVYGEFKFVPRQRWIHNLEHGAVVMLYHPCANQNEVNLLRNIVRRCLYKHVITPYNLLSSTRPLALVTWGHRLEMSKVSKNLAIRFIKEHALKGSETTPKNGQYTLLLSHRANVVSDVNDSVLCPNDRNIMK